MLPHVKALWRIFSPAVGGVLLLCLLVGGGLGAFGRINAELRRGAGFGEGSADWKSAIQQVGNLRYDRSAVAAVVASSGDPASGAAPGSQLKIVTTILPLYCFTAGVAGDLAQVDNLLPENASGHDHQLSARDARKLSNADIVIATGLGLEDSLLGRRLKTPAVKAGAGVEAIRGHIHEDQRHGDDVNPHFWLDPLLAAHAVTNILEALQKADPRNAEAYARNGAAYVERLHKLHADINTTLAPHRGRTLVTYHDAFPYFARRYGLHVAGVVQEVADVEPTPRHLAELRAVVREQKASVICMETGGDVRRVKQLAADLGVEIATLDPLESGALSPGAYEEGMRRNAESIRKAFDASVP